MLRLSHALVLLLVLVMLMPESDGWFWRKKRPRPIYRRCNCIVNLKQLLHYVKGLGYRKNLGRRDVSSILDVDEGDPLLAELMQKRDGVVTKEELYDAVKRAYTHLSSDVKRTIHCHCGHKVLKHLGRSLE